MFSFFSSYRMGFWLARIDGSASMWCHKGRISSRCFSYPVVQGQCHQAHVQVIIITSRLHSKHWENIFFEVFYMIRNWQTKGFHIPSLLNLLVFDEIIIPGFQLKAKVTFTQRLLSKVSLKLVDVQSFLSKKVICMKYHLISAWGVCWTEWLIKCLLAKYNT